MKIIIIGDTHGHNGWQRVLEEEKEWDEVIFLGDYFDNFARTPSQDQLAIYEEIKKIPKVTMLLGNHDFHYIMDEIAYSGWREETYNLIHERVTEDYLNGKLPVVVKRGWFVMSHAGVTKTWLKKIMGNTLDTLLEKIKKGNRKSLKHILKKLHMNYDTGFSPYGDTISQSPIWIRPRSLNIDNIDTWTQIVGHTHSSGVMNYDRIHVCDTMPNQYMILEGDNEDNLEAFMKNVM